MADLDAYLALITSWHRSKPRFTATVSATLAPFAEGQAVLAGFSAAFDLDSAVGAQLDIDGEWIGQTRFVTHPVRGNWFAWDDAARGWDLGVWRGPYDVSVGTYQMEDDRYRRLLKALALGNRADAPLSRAQAVLDAYFPGPDTRAFVEDRTGHASPAVLFAWDTPGHGWDEGEWDPLLFGWDEPGRGWDEARWVQPFEDDDRRTMLGMDLAIVVTGQIPDAIDLAILAQGLLRIKPQGVSVETIVTTQSGAPVFGFDADNSRVGGWDYGAWGADPNTIALADL